MARVNMRAFGLALTAGVLAVAVVRPVDAGPPGSATIVAGQAPAQADSLTREEARAIVARGPRPANVTTNATEASSAELRDALAAAKRSPSAATLDRAAQAYLALGVRDQAFDQYAEAVRRDARDAVAHEGMARIWRDWGWRTQALSAAYRAVYHAPASSQAWNTLGTILERVGHSDDARVAYERSRSLGADAWWADVNLCGLELTGNRLREADRHCRRVLDRHPGQPDASRLLHEIETRLDASQGAASTATGKTRP